MLHIFLKHDHVQRKVQCTQMAKHIVCPWIQLDTMWCQAYIKWTI